MEATNGDNNCSFLEILRSNWNKPKVHSTVYTPGKTHSESAFFKELFMYSVFKTRSLKVRSNFRTNCFQLSTVEKKNLDKDSQYKFATRLTK